jgi:hypothetical protein
MVVLLSDVIGAGTYTLIGGFLGIVLLIVSSAFVPRIMNSLTPKIDEEKEILKGNVAVAHYFGRIVQALIIGISIIIASAIIAGIHGW